MSLTPEDVDSLCVRFTGDPLPKDGMVHKLDLDEYLYAAFRGADTDVLGALRDELLLGCDEDETSVDLSEFLRRVDGRKRQLNSPEGGSSSSPPARKENSGTQQPKHSGDVNGDGEVTLDDVPDGGISGDTPPAYPKKQRPQAAKSSPGRQQHNEAAKDRVDDETSPAVVEAKATTSMVPVSAAENSSAVGVVGAPTEQDLATILRGLSLEEIDMLRDAFIRLDRNGDGFVDKEELLLCVHDVVGDRYEGAAVYLDKIFSVADKDRDNRLSLSEFLSSFAEGPGVVPSEVVLHCVESIRVRLTDVEICFLQESFRSVDANDDGFIDENELFTALKGLLRPKFPDLDDAAIHTVTRVALCTADYDGDGKLSLAEFIRSFQESQGVLPTEFITEEAEPVVAIAMSEAETTALVRELEAVLREYPEGFVHVSELHAVVSRALVSATDELGEDGASLTNNAAGIVDLVVMGAKRFSDGSLSLAEFVERYTEVRNLGLAMQQQLTSGLVLPPKSSTSSGQSPTKPLSGIPVNGNGVAQNGHVGGGSRSPGLDHVDDAVQEAEDEEEQEAEPLPPLSVADLERLHLIFVNLDLNGDGFLDRSEICPTLEELISARYPEWTPSMVAEVIDTVVECADVDGDGKISLNEFIGAYRDGQEILPNDYIDSTLSMMSPPPPHSIPHGFATQMLHHMEQLPVTHLTAEDLHYVLTIAAAESSYTMRPHHVAGVMGAVMSFVSYVNESGEVDDDGGCFVPFPPFLEAFARRFVDQSAGGSEPASPSQPEAHKRSRPHRPESPEPGGGSPPDGAQVANGEAPPLKLSNSADIPPQREPAQKDANAGQNGANPAARPPKPPQKNDGTPTPSGARRPAPPSAESTPGGAHGQPAHGGSARQQRYRVPTPTLPTSMMFPNDVSGVAVSESQLRQLFSKYDKYNTGRLDRAEFKRSYLGMENYGVDPSERYVDGLFNKYASDPEFMSFEEFCVVMLHRSKM